MQLKNGIAQVTLIQTTLNHLESSHFLGNEQHRFLLTNQLGDDVGDRLRLTRTRWPLDNQVGSLTHLQNGFCLAAVGVLHEAHITRLDHRVDVYIFCIRRGPIPEA